ncbi:hypothetical protein ACOMHN_025796 [Nucella lapillus]
MMAEADISYDPSRNYDEESMSLQKEIEKEIAEHQQLIGPCQPVEDLIEEYANEDQVYRQKLIDLRKRYSHIRKVRGDGNCFFRGFGFAYLETLMKDKEEHERFLKKVEKTQEELLALGFQKFTLEDFYDTFVEIADHPSKDNANVEDLLHLFNDQGLSDYFVVYLRLIVSGHLQMEADFYSNFIEGGRTPKEFCSQEVEPMGKESDHIHIMSLASALNTGILVEYMDRGGQSCNQVIVPEGAEPCVCLLYRPGHYDILYTKN